VQLALLGRRRGVRQVPVRQRVRIVPFVQQLRELLADLGWQLNGRQQR